MTRYTITLRIFAVGKILERHSLVVPAAVQIRKEKITGQVTIFDFLSVSVYFTLCT